eukprot:6206035-Prymnesium_polylepis.1
MAHGRPEEVESRCTAVEEVEGRWARIQQVRHRQICAQDDYSASASRPQRGHGPVHPRLPDRSTCGHGRGECCA